MRLLIDIEQNGKHSKCTTSTPPECIREELMEMCSNSSKRLEDRRKIAVSLVAMALGLHDDHSVLFAQFNQQSKAASITDAEAIQAQACRIRDLVSENVQLARLCEKCLVSLEAFKGEQNMPTVEKLMQELKHAIDE